MSSYKCTGEADTIQELKGIGLSSDQIFQLLMKKEEVMIEKGKPNQKAELLSRLSPDQMFQLLMKKEERKILELEENSKKRKHEDTQPSLSPSESDNPLSSKKVCNQYPNRKSMHDLCNDELLSILDFIPDFGVFKLARVSKQFNEIVLNNIKKVHLATKFKKDNTIEGFVNSKCFQNVESLSIDFEIQFDLVEIILKNSDNLRVLKISISNDNKFHYLQFSIYPSSSFKKLETLHIKCSNERLRLEMRHFNLYNLTELRIEGIKRKVPYFLNERTNNIKKLYLKQVNCDLRIPTMKMLTHLTLEECKISDSSLCSLLVDTLEYVSIETCKSIEHDDNDLEEELEIPSEFPNLKTLIATESDEIDITTMFESKLSNLTNLVLDKLTKDYAIALSENTSITSLKKLFIYNIEEWGELKMLIESKTFFKVIESMEINATRLDSNALLYISKNTSTMGNNLKVLEILERHSSGLNGYQAFFTSEHFVNLEKLTITFPNQMEDLNYLAQTTTCFSKLKTLHVIGTIEKPPENFFSLFSNNTNFNQLSELGCSFLDDSSISYIKSMENLHTVYVSKKKVTAWGLKQLDEQELKWIFIEDHFGQ